MKKFLFSILAVGAIVACTKSEVNYEDSKEIAFAPVATNATKAVTAAIDGTAYPNDEKFVVWAYWQALDANTDVNNFTAASTYINGKAFEKVGGYWKGAAGKSYTWPKTGSLIFACLSPLEAQFSNVNHSLGENKFTFDYTNPANTANTVDLLWANNTPKSFDQNTVAVPVEFKHALSWITFTVKGEGDAINNYVINNIILENVRTKAKFDSKNGGTWSGQDSPNAIMVWNGAEALTAESKVIENNSRGTLVIPQKFSEDTNKKYTATLVYTNNTGDNPIKEKIVLDLNNEWVIGKRYVYNITFNTKEILINPTVADWTIGANLGFNY